MASKAGLSTKSLITLRAAADDSVKEKSFCNWGRKFAAGSVQGAVSPSFSRLFEAKGGPHTEPSRWLQALMLPDCPANSVRCEDRPHLCTVGHLVTACRDEHSCL